MMLLSRCNLLPSPPHISMDSASASSTWLFVKRMRVFGLILIVNMLIVGCGKSGTTSATTPAAAAGQPDEGVKLSQYDKTLTNGDDSPVPRGVANGVGRHRCPSLKKKPSPYRQGLQDERPPEHHPRRAPLPPCEIYRLTFGGRFMRVIPYGGTSQLRIPAIGPADDPVASQGQREVAGTKDLVNSISVTSPN